MPTSRRSGIWPRPRRTRGVSVGRWSPTRRSRARSSTSTSRAWSGRARSRSTTRTMFPPARRGPSPVPARSGCRTARGPGRPPSTRRSRRAATRASYTSTTPIRSTWTCTCRVGRPSAGLSRSPRRHPGHPVGRCPGAPPPGRPRPRGAPPSPRRGRGRGGGRPAGPPGPASPPVHAHRAGSLRRRGGAGRVFLKCLAADASFGAVVAGDGRWHALTVGVLCPAATRAVHLDLRPRHAGPGATSFRALRLRNRG